MTALFLSLVLLLSGCGRQEQFDPEKFLAYVCYDYPLACLDAGENKSFVNVEYDTGSYNVVFRKPVGVSEDQFICASVQHALPLSGPQLVIMQNPDDYVDLWWDWTVKQIEIYYTDINASKQLWEEDEPVRTPTKVLATVSDQAVLSELADFLTSDSYSEKFTLPDNYTRESYSARDSYKLYVRIYFNDAENIVWDSEIKSYISGQLKDRYIVVDKGRTPSGVASPSVKDVSINGLKNMTSLLSDVINDLVSD